MATPLTSTTGERRGSPDCAFETALADRGRDNAWCKCPRQESNLCTRFRNEVRRLLVDGRLANGLSLAAHGALGAEYAFAVADVVEAVDDGGVVFAAAVDPVALSVAGEDDVAAAAAADGAVSWLMVRGSRTSAVPGALPHLITARRPQT
jgi:hypothetical protein